MACPDALHHPMVWHHDLPLSPEEVIPSRSWLPTPGWSSTLTCCGGHLRQLPDDLPTRHHHDLLRVMVECPTRGTDYTLLRSGVAPCVWTCPRPLCTGSRGMPYCMVLVVRPTMGQRSNLMYCKAQYIRTPLSTWWVGPPASIVATTATLWCHIDALRQGMP